MADALPTNIVCTGPRYQSIYYVYDNKLTVVNRDGTFITEYYFAGNLYDIVDITYSGPIDCSSDYDGAVFYTVSYVSNDVSFIKWELDFNQNSLIPRKTMVYPKQGYYWFFVNGLSTQTYRRELSSALSAGTNHVHINSVVNIEVGQEAVIGLSSAGTSLDAVERLEVDHVVGDLVYFTASVVNDYKVGDSITFIDHVLCSSRYGISGSAIPAIYFMDRDGLYVSYFKTLYQLKSCTCTDFNNDLLYMGSKYNIFIYDCINTRLQDTVYSYQVCSGYKDVYGLLVWSSTELSTVQEAKVEFHNFSCTTTSFSDYGTVDYILSPFVSLVAVATTGFINDDTVSMEATITDQYIHGLFNINVSLESDDPTGSITCSGYNTDLYGKVYFEYTIGDAQVQVVKAYVDSTYVPRSDDYVYGYCYIYNNDVSYSTQYGIESLPNKEIDAEVSLSESELEYNESITQSDNRFYHTYRMEFTNKTIQGSYSIVNGLSDYSTNYMLTCDSNIQGDSALVLYQNATAYTNGPINVDVDISMFEFLSYFKPIPYSERNSENSIINFYIFPSTYKFNLSTFKVMWLEENEYRNYNSGWLDITNSGTLTLVPLGGDRNAVQFSYTKPERYFYSSVVHVYIEIYDTAPIPNVFKYQCYFGIVDDYTAPEVFMSYPECNSVGVPLNDNIVVGVNDDGMGIDTDSIEILVDGISVYYTVYTVSSGVVVVYDNNSGFLPGSDVLYSIGVSDLKGNRLHHTCRFIAETSNAPEIVPQDVCGKVVDNRFSFYFDVFDTGGGIKLDSVELILNDKLAKFITSNILYRIE